MGSISGINIVNPGSGYNGLAMEEIIHRSDDDSNNRVYVTLPNGDSRVSPGVVYNPLCGTGTLGIAGTHSTPMCLRHRWIPPIGHGVGRPFYMDPVNIGNTVELDIYGDGLNAQAEVTAAGFLSGGITNTSITNGGFGYTGATASFTGGFRSLEEIFFKAEATDSGRVEKVEFYCNGKPLQNISQNTATFKPDRTGIFEVVSVVYDDEGNINTSEPYFFEVEKLKEQWPTIEIMSPKHKPLGWWETTQDLLNLTQETTIPITIRARDFTTKVGVLVYADGQLVGKADRAGESSQFFLVTDYFKDKPAGQYEIKAQALDSITTTSAL